MPRKKAAPRLEGEVRDLPAVNVKIVPAPRIEAVEAALSDHVALKGILERFKDQHPVVWERIRLGPAHHAIDDMIATLGG